jgi:hypothetical protein
MSLTFVQQKFKKINKKFYYVTVLLINLKKNIKRAMENNDNAKGITVIYSKHLGRTFIRILTNWFCCLFIAQWITIDRHAVSCT